jgi:hypothetical protein
MHFLPEISYCYCNSQRKDTLNCVTFDGGAFYFNTTIDVSLSCGVTVMYFSAVTIAEVNIIRANTIIRPPPLLVNFSYAMCELGPAYFDRARQNCKITDLSLSRRTGSLDSSGVVEGSKTYC